jgi:hypothetical protein
MRTLSREFDATIESTIAVLAKPHDGLPEDRRLRLLSIFVDAYLPNVSMRRGVHVVKTPEGVALGRVAILPITPKRSRPFLYDPRSVIDRYGPEVDEDMLAKVHQKRRARASHLIPEGNGVTKTGRFTTAGRAYKGETLIALRALGWFGDWRQGHGERVSVALHEGTHAILHQDDPNLQVRANDPEGTDFLDAQAEVECYTTSLLLADRTGISDTVIADRLERVEMWRTDRGLYTPTTELDMSPFAVSAQEGLL